MRKRTEISLSCVFFCKGVYIRYHYEYSWLYCRRCKCRLIYSTIIIISGLSFRFYAQKTGKTTDCSRDVRAATYTIELSPSFAELGVEHIQQVNEEVLLKGMLYPEKQVSKSIPRMRCKDYASISYNIMYYIILKG